jgi:archaellum component FlaC
MATPNPQEIQRLLDKLEAAYRRLGETNPFQNFDVNQFRDATTAVRALEDGLRGVEDRLDSVRGDLDYINKSLTDSLNELSKQDVYLKMQKSSLSDISNIARQALAIRRGESDLNDKILKKLKEQTRENIRNLENVRDAYIKQGKSTEEIDKQITSAKDLEKNLKDIEDTYENINSKLGFMPKIAGGIDKALSKLGLPDFGFSEALNDTLKAGQAAEGLGQEFNVVGEFTKRAGENLKGMLSKANLIQFAITQLVDALIKTDKNTGELAKNMGVSYEESLNMASSMSTIANLSGETYVTTENLVKAQMSLSKAFGTNTLLSGELLKDYAQITEQAGYSAEAATSLGKITQATGGDLSKNTASILGAATAFNATNKLALNEKEIVEEVAKTGAATVLTFNKSTKALADNVLQAKKFGLNLEQASKISEGLLNFQSSIESEIEAELLTGKQLNFEQARFLALQGETGAAAAEVAKQIGGSAEFGKMNVIQQEALAKSVGLSRDELAQSILDREVLSKLGEKEGSAQDAYNKLKKQGLSDDAIAAKLGDEKLAAQLKSQSVQERFNATVAKLQDIFVSVAEPILGIVSPLMDLVSTVLPAINFLLSPLIEGFSIIGGAVASFVNGLKEGNPLALTLAGILATISAKSIISAVTSIFATLAQIPFGVGLPLAGIAVAGMISLISKTKTMKDGIIDPKKGPVVSGEFGTVQLNPKDSIVAGTNLGGAGRTQAPTSSPSMDLSPLLAKMDQMNTILNQLLAKEGTVTLDGNKVGTALTVGSYKMQ